MSSTTDVTEAGELPFRGCDGSDPTLVERAPREELHELTVQLTTLVSALKDGVLFVDDDRRVVLVNRSLTELFDIPGSPDDLRGRTDVDLLSSASAPFADGHLAASVIEQRYNEAEPTIEELVTMLDGRVFERDSIPVQSSSSRRGHLWVYRDVTAREELARRRADLLEDSRHARLRAEQQNRALLELTEMRSQFVATVSHELRTPLTSIVGFSELLRGDLDVDGWEEQRSFVDAIERNAQRLLRLVNDLLLLRRIESGVLPMERMLGTMDALVGGAVDAIRPLAADRHHLVNVAVAPGPAVVGDLGRLDQVLVNLLSNAVKFTPEGGTIEITADHDDRDWRIVVRDNGVGIPRDEQSHLFEQFYRGPHASDRVPGTGLGLVISKAVIERHDGTIAIESEFGEGTTVSVRLPIKEASDA